MNKSEVPPAATPATPETGRVRINVSMPPSVHRSVLDAMAAHGEDNFSRAVQQILIEANAARTPYFCKRAR